MTDRPLIQVEASPTFRRNLRTLFKKYRSIRKDVQPVIARLEQRELPGDKMSGVGHDVFKLRIRNNDNQKGKSGGYRLIYYVKTAVKIILLTIYTKSEQVDIAADDLRSIIAEYEKQAVEDKEDV